MPQYETKESRHSCNIPEWRVTTGGLDGCGTQLCYSSSFTSAAPSSTTKFYNPITEFASAPRFPPQSGRTRGRIRFAQTAYSRSRITSRSFLTRRANGSSAKVQYCRLAHKEKVGGTCTVVTDSVWMNALDWNHWVDVSHEGTGSHYIVSEISNSDVRDAIADVQAQMSVEARTSYDLLTEIAEVREIPSLIRSISNDMTNIMKMLHGRYPRELKRFSRSPITTLLKHPERMARELGSKWMEYRYAIMPLVYSYRDLKKTLNRGQDVTSHAFRSVTPCNLSVSLPPNTVDYQYTTVQGSVDIRGTVFQRYNYSGSAMLAGVGFNPLVTAWELIPYSFVVDWFINVGDYITAKTSPILAGTTLACISKRSRYKTIKYQHFCDSTISLNPTRTSDTVGSLAPQYGPPVTIPRPEESQPLQETEVDAYTRWLVNVDAVPLRFKPSLNWRRLLDSAVLANNQLRACKRFFR